MIKGMEICRRNNAWFLYSEELTIDQRKKTFKKISGILVCINKEVKLERRWST